jgi:uncharacterized sulfatase
MGGWPATGNAPLRDEKGTVYEGGIRVPAIVRWPGVVPPGTRTATPAVITDLVPTLLEIAGVPYEVGSLDGASLAGVLREPARPVPPRRLFWHYPHYHHGRPAGAVREGRYKLLEHFDTEAVELYDLEADIGETRDLAAAEPDRARQLLEALRALRRDTGAAMPRENPAFEPRRAGEWWSRTTVAPTEAPGTPRPGELDPS